MVKHGKTTEWYTWKKNLCSKQQEDLRQNSIGES